MVSFFTFWRNPLPPLLPSSTVSMVDTCCCLAALSCSQNERAFSCSTYLEAAPFEVYCWATLLSCRLWFSFCARSFRSSSGRAECTVTTPVRSEEDPAGLGCFMASAVRTRYET